MQILWLISFVLGMWCPVAEAQTAWPGHGGPIRAVAADGSHIVSGSFDGTALVWPEGLVLRGHDGAVNAVALLGDGAVVTGGADGRVRLHAFGREPASLGRHTEPVAGLTTQGERIASAGWDGTVRLWTRSGPAGVLTGHDGPVNAVAFAPDGSVVSAGYDGTLRHWDADGTAAILRLGVPLNAVAVAQDGQIIVGGADGVLRFLGPAAGEVRIDTAAITGLALSEDGTRVAVVSLGGLAMVVDRETARIVTVLNGAEKLLWGVGFSKGEVITGGGDRVLRRWDAGSGRLIGVLGTAPPPEPVGAGRGAQVFRACSACHSVAADGGNRAGPSLHHLFGRRVGTLPGYDYSPALRASDIVWSAETVARLFTIGPNATLPGTKMPEQVVSLPADREALLRYLEQATR